MIEDIAVHRPGDITDTTIGKLHMSEAYFKQAPRHFHVMPVTLPLDNTQKRSFRFANRYTQSIHHEGHKGGHERRVVLNVADSWGLEQSRPKAVQHKTQYHSEAAHTEAEGWVGEKQKLAFSYKADGRG